MQPALLEATGGLLDVTLTASYLDTRLPGSIPGQYHTVSLRAYGHDAQGPGVSGPTLVVRGGDQLRIRLVNNLPLNPPRLQFRDPANYLSPNTTNLHTHGLHVDPSAYPDRHPPEYGDYVVDSRTGGVQPRGGARQYVHHIPANHPAGPFYYHPQYHGSSAIQAASLMCGALLVRGPVDDLPEMAQARELIFLFQAPYYSERGISSKDGVKPGLLETFAQIAKHPAGHGAGASDASHLDSRPVLINGVRHPTIVMRRGEVHRWRLINAQVFNPLNLSLDGHTLLEYTTDGWERAAWREYPDATRHPGKGIVLGPGNRSSILLRGGEPGTYLLRSLPLEVARGSRSATLTGQILAKIVVIDTTTTMNWPARQLPVSPLLKPITDLELARAGGRKRSIVFNLLGNEEIGEAREARSAPGSTIGQVAAAAAEMAAEIAAAAGKLIAQTADDLIRMTGLPRESTQPARPVASPAPDYQLQPANPIGHTVILDAVEEWTLFNCNPIAHCVHIHVNPMYVTRVNGVSIDPYWCDTVTLPAGGTPEMPTTTTIRMRFKDFSGPFILHSQMLQYADLGMIQRVTVVPA